MYTNHCPTHKIMSMTDDSLLINQSDAYQNVFKNQTPYKRMQQNRIIKYITLLTNFGYQFVAVLLTSQAV